MATIRVDALLLFLYHFRANASTHYHIQGAPLFVLFVRTFFDLYTHETADVLLNVCCKDIGLAVNTGETNYAEIERTRGMIANENIMKGSNSYENVKTFKYLGSRDKSKFYS